jgi:diguanylate cyclase (GGDEF)-like protein
VERRPRILIVDDSITVRQYIQGVLSEDGGPLPEFFEAEEGRAALAILDREPVDLVLCDVMMPVMDGFTFLGEMKGRPEQADTPVIMLTAEGSVDMKVRCLEAGASDYVTKPFADAELSARVGVHLKIKFLQDELRRANEKFRDLSITDPLTGLFNRRHFIEILSREYSKAKRHDLPLTFMILDIDHFKRINDTYGHPQGDTVITELSTLLKGNVRVHDIVARYGGEEFVVLLPMTGREDGRMVAEKLRGAVRKTGFTGMDGRPVTVSIGVCALPVACAAGLEGLIAAADDSLYRAKEAGRDRVVVHDCESHAGEPAGVHGAEAPRGKK